GPVVPDGDGFQCLVAEQFLYLGVQQHLYVRDPLDLVDKVPRHVLGQIVLADDERDLRGVPGQEDGGLPGRVAAADDRHRVTAAGQRLRLGGRVVDTHLLEMGQPWHVEAAVPGPGGYDH